MKMSVREARAQFATALAAVEKGESVTITKNGKAVAELGPPPKTNSINWERAERWRKERGYDRLPPDPRSDEEWFADFNDPVFTEMMLGNDKEDLIRK